LLGHARFIAQPFSALMYTLWFAALLGACDTIQDGHHIGHNLGVSQKLGIVKKR